MSSAHDVPFRGASPKNAVNLKPLDLWSTSTYESRTVPQLRAFCSPCKSGTRHGRQDMLLFCDSAFTSFFWLLCVDGVNLSRSGEEMEPLDFWKCSTWSRTTGTQLPALEWSWSRTRNVLTFAISFRFSLQLLQLHFLAVLCVRYMCRQCRSLRRCRPLQTSSKIQ